MSTLDCWNLAGFTVLATDTEKHPMTVVRIHRYTPTDSRLGRHVRHDPHSRNYEFVPPVGTVPKTVDWPINAPTLDQGQLGSCTGNALAQWLNTDFAQHALVTKYGKTAGYLNEQAAVSLYSKATTLDGAPGQYPPTDTGSDGLSVCKAGVQLGYLSGYQHVFGFDALLAALQHTPVIVGTEWLSGMFRPNASTDVLSVRGTVDGGHEYLVRGCDVGRQHITIHNSWGGLWGSNGDAYITFRAFKKLLAADGDITVPVI